MAQPLTLEQMNARLAGSARPGSLSIEDMNRMLSGGGAPSFPGTTGIPFRAPRPQGSLRESAPVADAGPLAAPSFPGTTGVPVRAPNIRQQRMEAGNQQPTQLEQEITAYEAENPFLTRAGQRLKAGALGLGQSVSASRAADLADFNQRLFANFDAIDQGKRPDMTGSGPSNLRSLTLQYFGAAPDERAELRASYEGALGQQVERAVDYGQRSAAIPRNPVVAEATQALDERRFGDAWKAFTTDPLGFIGQVGMESLPRAAPGIAAAPFVGPVAAFGLSSFGSEYGTAIMGGLQDAGVDVSNPQAVTDALRDPALMKQVRDKARTRALAIGAFDAASGGLASKTLAPQLGSEAARQLVNIPAQSVAQGTLGAAGEATAQVATGEPLQLGQIGAEFAGEFFGAPAEVAGAAANARLYGSRPDGSGVSGRSDIQPVGGGIDTPLPAPAPPPSPPPSATPAPPQAAPEAPAGPATPTPATGAPGAIEAVFTPRGRSVDVRYEVVDAGSLIPSHTDDLAANPQFPAALQPRERTRAASQAQIAEIAGNLEPALLGRSASASDGAPIIGPDGVVESGNARVLAIRRAYQQMMPSAQKYRASLAEQGYNIEGMTAPVLVRRRVTDLSPADREAFTREANERTTLTPSAAEQAASDAKGMPPGLTDLYRGGDLNAAANREFVRRFVDAVIPTSERGSMFDSSGALSQDGLRRLENALFSSAYEDTAILGSLRESQDTNIKSIGNAMVDAAPDWMRLRADVAAGQVRPEMDITPALVEAAKLVSQARRQGTTVADLVNQSDMFGGISAEAKAVLGLMFRDPGYKRPVSRQRLASALTYYSDQARQATGGGFDLGDAPVTPSAILDLARNGGTGDLMGDTAASRTPGTTGQTALSLEQMNQKINAAVAAGPGAQFKGQIRDKFDATVASRKGDPLRRESILRELVTALGMPLYEGRIKSKDVLGFFRKPVEEIRVKKMGDIETAAHEIAHLLDNRFPEIRRQWNPPTKANAAIRAELRGVSYDQSKLYEGFAEFVRLWATQQDEAKARAPLFHGWFEDFVARNQHGPALRRAQQQMHDWFAQSALDRARSKIGQTDAINDALAKPWDKLRQSILDDLQGVATMERTLTGEISPAGVYETARLVRGAASITEGALTLGAPKANADGSHTFVGKGLREILDPVGERLDDFVMYAVGRSANELMQQGREHLFTAAEIKGMLALQNPVFERAFREYQDWNNAILDFAQAKGIINPDARRMFRRNQYLPFHRVGQPGTPASAVPGDWKGIKALTGGTDNLRDIIGNMIGNAAMLIEGGLINEARVKVANLASEKSGARFMARIPTEDRAVKVHRAEVERAILEALGVRDIRALDVDEQAFVDKIVDGLDSFVPLLLRGQAPAGRNVVAVLRAGKPEYWEVADPLVYRSLMALKREVPHWITQWLAVPKRLGQLTITMTPDFVAANFARDTLSGFVFSRHGFKPFVDSARGIISRLKADETYKEFIANGGGFSSYLVDEGAFRANLAQFYKRKGINYQTVLDTPKKAWLGLERIADSFEMATRLGEFRRARERGEHPRHAAYSAREISTDFAMRGDSAVMGFLYDTIIFLKAGMNGLDRAYRGIAQDPNRGSIAFKTGMIAAISGALYLINRGNPLYDDLEDWEKDTHWHFYIPKPETLQAWADGQTPPPPEEAYWHLLYPKIWEVGAVSSIAERQLEGVLDGQPVEAQKHTLRVFLDLFGFDYLPQAVSPLYELAINRDRFRDSPIEGQGLRELEPWARASPYTSRTLRAMGEASRGLPREFQISPVQAEHLLRGYFGTWALYGLTVSDSILFDDKPEMRADQLPVLRRFFRQEPSRSSKHVNELYEMIDAATETRRTMRAMLKRERPDLAGEYRAEPENLMYGPLSKAQQRLRLFRGRIEQVYGSPTLEETQRLAMEHGRTTEQPGFVGKAKMGGQWDDQGKLKRVMIDDLIRLRDEFAERFVTTAKERRAQMEAAQEGGGLNGE